MGMLVPVIQEQTLSDRFILGPCSPGRIEAVEALYADLHDGRELGWSKRVLLRLVGRRLCVALIDLRTNRVLGMVLGYFNPRDVRERTIHIGFTGLAPEVRGQGLSYDLRRFAYAHYARSSWLRGVSSRISVDNVASLRGAVKLGYVERERYFDKELGVERVYMFCDLTPFRVADDASRTRDG